MGCVKGVRQGKEGRANRGWEVRAPLGVGLTGEGYGRACGGSRAGQGGRRGGRAGRQGLEGPRAFGCWPGGVGRVVGVRQGREDGGEGLQGFQTEGSLRF